LKKHHLIFMGVLIAVLITAILLPFATTIEVGHEFVSIGIRPAMAADGYFGLSSGTNDNASGANYLVGTRYQNTVGAGTLTKIEYYLNDTTPTGNAGLAVYADNSGSPGALLYGSGQITLVNGWNVISGLSLAVTNGTWYWLTYLMQNDNTNRYSVGASNSMAYRAYTWAAFPNPFGTPGGWTNQDIVIRAWVDVPDTPSITNSPSSKAFGVLDDNATHWSKGSAPTFPVDDSECYFTLTNNGSVAVNLTANATNPTGGIGATCVDGNPGANEIRVSLYTEGDGSSDNTTIKSGVNRSLYSNLAPSTDIGWEVKLEIGTSTETPPTQKTFIIKIIAATA
jgi:hypothetical protein